MSDKHTLVLHTVMLVVLAALLLVVVRNFTGEIQILHDRLATLSMNGAVPHVPVAGADGA